MSCPNSLLGQAEHGTTDKQRPQRRGPSVAPGAGRGRLCLPALPPRARGAPVLCAWGAGEGEEQEPSSSLAPPRRRLAAVAHLLPDQRRDGGILLLPPEQRAPAHPQGSASPLFGLFIWVIYLGYYIQQCRSSHEAHRTPATPGEERAQQPPAPGTSLPPPRAPIPGSLGPRSQPCPRRKEEPREEVGGSFVPGARGQAAPLPGEGAESLRGPGCHKAQGQGGRRTLIESVSPGGRGRQASAEMSLGPPQCQSPALPSVLTQTWGWQHHKNRPRAWSRDAEPPPRTPPRNPTKNNSRAQAEGQGGVHSPEGLHGVGGPWDRGTWGWAQLQQAVTRNLSHHLLAPGSCRGGEGILLASLGPWAQS